VVRSHPFHGCSTGSNPVPSTIFINVMRIIGFGDSFIQPVGKTRSDKNYVQITSEFLGSSSFSTYGIPGSSVWKTFFEFKEKMEMHRRLNIDVDVIIFVWTNNSRLYHPEVNDICLGNSLLYSEVDNPIWVASRYYFEELYDHEKTSYEMLSFYYWFDNWLLQNTPRTTKIIHMWGFPFIMDDIDVHGQKFDDQTLLIKNSPEKIKYSVNFKSGVEIRPPLLHFSLNDDWPEDLSKEHRFQHLTESMHEKVSQLLTDAIINFRKGKIIGGPSQTLI